MKLYNYFMLISMHSSQQYMSPVNICNYYNVFICSTSYEERLKCLVLKEEFALFLDEVNHSITTMTAAGKGNDTPFILILYKQTTAITHSLAIGTACHSVSP